jgi:hypothetical protein
VGMYSLKDVVTRQKLAGDDAPANRPRHGSKEPQRANSRAGRYPTREFMRCNP